MVIGIYLKDHSGVFSIFFLLSTVERWHLLFALCITLSFLSLIFSYFSFCPQALLYEDEKWKSNHKWSQPPRLHHQSSSEQWDSLRHRLSTPHSSWDCCLQMVNCPFNSLEGLVTVFTLMSVNYDISNRGQGALSTDSRVPPVKFYRETRQSIPCFI